MGLDSRDLGAGAPARGDLGSGSLDSARGKLGLDSRLLAITPASGAGFKAEFHAKRVKFTSSFDFTRVLV
jgi:hypothetical protein